MKLYVWRDVYPVSYGQATAFAIAESLDQAWEQLKTAGTSKYGYEPEEGRGIDLTGKLPDWIVDAPVSFIHFWQE